MQPAPPLQHAVFELEEETVLFEKDIAIKM
jgi:hypothetical protein